MASMLYVLNSNKMLYWFGITDCYIFHIYTGF